MRTISYVMSLCLLLMTFSFQAHAESEKESAAKAKIENLLKMQVSEIKSSPIQGLYQVMTERGLFYVSEDAKYFVHGRIFNLDEGMRNETEDALASVRISGMKKFENDMIEFKAKDEKYEVTVFTDITCGYCRRLHNQIAEYNDLGITVRYLAFPRGGPNSKAFGDMQSVWCSKNKREAMTAAKAGDSVHSASCSNKVHDQYMFGMQVGVNGTPAIMLADGSMLPGYQPPQQLEQLLKTL
ncbi:bifunctional protein-disulfide isomerase/oxidoreductase DsbC [Alteromonas sp. a30]|uniref:bifunctional protein-disulfide isomerase/oxidoreductase DsbC n=1 Tax=Alteromonas sp. a30 TaxID=2730917 RepID=UPI0022819698|nr:bifunctional protein-disulfide isomerase/oxidoreductase DsbC [Alteromonas sp. a30]MCY7294298.1 bifunctional protein-disulfide isomerase/oxidoreductase DsbC [Alteromonas sp. a30]